MKKHYFTPSARALDCAPSGALLIGSTPDSWTRRDNLTDDRDDWADDDGTADSRSNFWYY
ncbi:MAG: hypothetical protein J6M53_00765 [Bacteroidaceae bacterium]|nr:hypothetical protein [Bacteroidaceae bacterium]